MQTSSITTGAATAAVPVNHELHSDEFELGDSRYLPLGIFSCYDNTVFILYVCDNNVITETA